MSTKQERTIRLYTRLMKLGYEYDEVTALLKASRQLTRWGEALCNGDVYRHENTRKPFYKNGTAYRDIEASALFKIGVIVGKHESHQFYHQQDPRGCALYILPPDTIPANGTVESHYTHGIAVCA